MIVDFKVSSLRDVKPHEYAMRFAFGGVCTVAAGVIAKRFGPAVGGLFLAFPAIFPAGASLIETHEREQKQKAGFDGARRGRVAASIDAAGAAIGCIGLVGFALVLWAVLPRHGSYVAVLLASLAWLVLSVGPWLVRKSRLLH